LTVQELFRAVCWPTVERAVRKLYPDDVDDIPGLRIAFAYIRGCHPRPNPEGWCLVVEPPKPGKEWFDVVAVWPGDGTRYGMDFQTFEVWAGMDVSEQTLGGFPPAEIVAHMLWEMTFWGYDNTAIVAKRKEIVCRLRQLVGRTGYWPDA